MLKALRIVLNFRIVNVNWASSAIHLFFFLPCVEKRYTVFFSFDSFLFQSESFSALFSKVPQPLTVSHSVVEESTQTVGGDWSRIESSPTRHFDWRDIGCQTDPKKFGETSTQTIPDPTKSDGATQTIDRRVTDGSTQTEPKSLVDREVQAEPEGLLVSGLPTQVCRISRIATFLEKFGCLSEVSVSKSNCSFVAIIYTIRATRSYITQIRLKINEEASVLSGSTGPGYKDGPILALRKSF